MFRNIRLFAVVGLVTLVAACAGTQEEEFVVVDPEPISVEPAYTGKFK